MNLDDYYRGFMLSILGSIAFALSVMIGVQLWMMV